MKERIFNHGAKRCIGVLVALATGATVAWGDIRYVDGNVASSGNGLTWETAYKTIADAYNALPSPVERQVIVRGDQMYAINAIIYFGKNGLSETERLVFTGVPGTNGLNRLPILHGAIDWDEAGFVQDATYPNVYYQSTAATPLEFWEGPLDGEWDREWSHYAKAKSIAEVQDTPGSWFLSEGTLYVQTSDGTHPEHFILKSSDVNQAFIVTADYVTFEGFEFRHFRSDVFTVRDSYRVVIRDNLMHSVPGRPVFFRDPGGTLFPPTHCDVIGNTIIGGGRCVDVNGANHLIAFNTLINGTVYAIESYSEGVRIAGNRIYDNERGMITYRANSRIYNNLIYDNPSSGIQVQEGTNTAVFNNTLRNVGSASQIRIRDDHARVFNNIAWASGSNHRAIEVDAANTGTFLSDYNALYATDGAHVGRWAGAYKTTLSDWQTDSGQDAHSISADPLFEDLDNRVFRLSGRSPCRDRGTALFDGISAPAMDIDHIRRPMAQGFDLGAHEHVPPGSILMVR